MSNVQNILKTIKEKEIQFVDLRFTDPRGKMQHVSQHVSTIDEDSLAEGFMFDGSSIAGWKAINESDMKLMPDCSRSVIDTFYSQPTLAIFCDVLGEMALQSTYTGFAPVARIASATAFACGSALAGGSIERMISACFTSVSRSPASAMPADAASLRVRSLRPARQVITSCPCSRSARPMP